MSSSAQEISKFSLLSSKWWNTNGPLGLLHSMNPVRIQYILNNLKTTNVQFPLSGLSVLDIGTGAGILAEPLNRLGATVTGIDASSSNIAHAIKHATLDPSLDITYKSTTAEDLLLQDPNTKYDIITSLEVLEHVNDPASFIQSCSDLLSPNGTLFLSTINKTPSSLLFTILAAEYVLNIVPIGTHHFDKYITLKEMDSYLTQSGLFRNNVMGLSLNPVTKKWKLSENLCMNYILCAKKSLSDS